MDEYTTPQGVVDPEVRAYVYSLVSALGGTGAEEDGRYVLGDDALAVLKDIKRWLKLYDEKMNRLDVARCLAEANLVKGDLLEILATWPEQDGEDRIKAKVALACLELLVPLTWPLEKEEMQITANHYQHLPYLQLAQISYKREILEHWSSSILHTAVRIALPSIALPISERSQRDEGIIKLLLYFLRNTVMISAPSNLPVEWNENEVSRSATIDAFQAQDVFALLLTIASNIGEDFNTQDVVIMELLFHLLKGVDVEKLFMDEVALDKKHSKELSGLMAKEAAMLRGYSKNAPTRHNRFGTMIWVKRDNERMSTVSGQDILLDGQQTLSKMDQSKKWNRPKQRKKEQRTNNHFDIPTQLNKTSKLHLRAFVEDFLDSGFNPLFNHLRRAIEREADRVLEIHFQQFLYLIGWFLEAERVRKAHKKANVQKNRTTESGIEADGYGLIASALNQETFILLNRYMQDKFDKKMWLELNAGMRCFTQILLTIQEMSESSIGEDQEIAENIQNRIFYEETTHDRVVSILRGYKDQGFSYLDACTELSHVFLRMLERYSKENIDLQIRSRRRARRKKKEAEKPQEGDADEAPASEAEDEIEAQRVSRERKFDFTRFAAKFVTQPCVDTFTTFVSYYRDLTNEQLKRAHRFFYRVAFKQEMSVMLYRLDIIALFHRMIKGPEGLNSTSPIFGEWQELVKQTLRRFVKKLQERPELFIEVLFSKLNSTAFYLEYGYEKQMVSTSSRAPAELEVKDSLLRDEQIGVVIAVLAKNDMDAVVFIEDALLSASSERESWEKEALAREIENGMEDAGAEESSDKPKPPSIVLKPDNEGRRIALFKNPRLRLLVTLCSLERLGEEDDPDGSWIFPSTLTSQEMKETVLIIEKHRKDPRESYGDGDDAQSPEDMLRRKVTPHVPSSRTTNIFGDDSDSELDALREEANLLPTNTLKARKPDDALAELKKRRRKRRRGADDNELEELADDVDEDAIRERKKARLLADIKKRQGYKSSEFVHLSDEEEDDERDRAFFDIEEARRKGTASKIAELMRSGKMGTENASIVSETKKGKKRKSGRGKADGGSKRRKTVHSGAEDGSNSGSEATDEELDTMLGLSSHRHTTPDHSANSAAEDEDEAQSSSPPSDAAPHNAHIATSPEAKVADQDTPISSPTPMTATQDELKEARPATLRDAGDDGDAENCTSFDTTKQRGPFAVDDDVSDEDRDGGADSTTEGEGARFLSARDASLGKVMDVDARGRASDDVEDEDDIVPSALPRRRRGVVLGDGDSDDE